MANIDLLLIRKGNKKEEKRIKYFKRIRNGIKGVRTKDYKYQKRRRTEKKQIYKWSMYWRRKDKKGVLRVSY